MTQQIQTASPTKNLKQLVELPAYQNRFRELLKDRAPQFVSSLVQLTNGSRALQSCDPTTIIAAAVTAAALDLPIDRNLGFAHIVPYKGQAAFQMGYKGFIQLAIRTGQYRFLNACIVHAGELGVANKLTSEVVIDPTKKTSDEVVGYAAYFKLVNGFEHSEYWTKSEVETHAKRYSQAYKSGYDTPWKSDFDQMALKTVIKDLLSHWGILSVEMQRAMINDQGVKSSVSVEDGAIAYPDNEPEPSKPIFEALPAPAVTETATAATPKGKRKQSTAPHEPKPVDDPPVSVQEPEDNAPFDQPDTEPKELTELRQAIEFSELTEVQVLKFAVAQGFVDNAIAGNLGLKRIAQNKLAKLTQAIAEGGPVVEHIKAL